MSVLLAFFESILEKSIYGTCCILFILLIRYLIKHFPKVFSYCLWAVAGFRLLFSFSFESIFSLIRLQPESLLTSKVLDTPIIQTQNFELLPSGNIVTMPMGDTIAPAATADMGYAAEKASLSLLELLSLVWLIGFLVFVGYGFCQYLRFSLKLKRMELHKLSYGNYQNICEVKGLSQAFTMGIIKPRIYLPQDMKQESRELVILHECTHIKRKDYIFKPLAYGILCLHWFNPFVWLGFSLFCRDMEMSCDESVIRQLDGDTLIHKKDYSKVLLSMAGNSPLNRFPLFFGEPGVKQRIKNILAYKKRTVVCSVILFGVLLAAAFCLLANPGTEENTADILGNGEENGLEPGNPGTLIGANEEEALQRQEEEAKKELEALQRQEEEVKKKLEELEEARKKFEELEEAVAKEEAAIRDAKFKQFKETYAAMMAQNEVWYDSIFHYSGDVSNPIGCYIKDPENPENQIIIFDGHIEDLVDTVVDEDIRIKSAVYDEPYLIITFENGESLSIDEQWEEGAPHPNLHFEHGLKYAYTDLNLDGEKELILDFDLEYAGGFGGSAILLYTHTPNGWVELAPPEGYDIKYGFSTQLVWDGNKMFFSQDGSTDLGLGSFTKEDLIAINELQGITMEFILSQFPEWDWDNISGHVDVPYTFSLYYEDSKPVLVTAEYVWGILGHNNGLGYLIREWRLLEDSTWDIQMYFLLMN